MANNSNIKNLDYIELNPEIKTIRNNPDLSDYENNRRYRDERINVDSTKHLGGERIGVALENARILQKPFPIYIQESLYFKDVEKLFILRVKVDDLVDQELPIITQDGKQIDEKFIISMHQEYIEDANSNKIKESPNKGDLVKVNIYTRRYLGLHSRSTIDAGKKENKQTIEQQIKKPTLSLNDTVSPPNSTNPVPSQTPKNPGLYQIFQLSDTTPKQSNTRPPDDIEMDFIPGTSKLFPKKYMNAINEMKKAFKNETGQELGITSAFRTNDEQKVLYDKYLQGISAPAAQPGFSKHQSGQAIDFSTGKIFNDDFAKAKLNQSLAFEKASSGQFGIVAKWLTLNSQRFGFRWTGYKIGELWHYDFDVNLAKQLGLIE